MDNILLEHKETNQPSASPQLNLDMKAYKEQQQKYGQIPIYGFIMVDLDTIHLVLSNLCFFICL